MYEKSIADTSVIECDEIKTAMDTVSEKKSKYYSNINYKYSFNKVS